MSLLSIYKKISNLNIFILAILFLLGLSAYYFFYYQQRNQNDIYIKINLIRQPSQTAGPYFNWLPYWIDKSISIGDKEVSPLRGISAEVIDKESYESELYGINSYLLLKVRVIKDRSGIYLYKNKPLSTGGVIDLKLSNTQVLGLVTYIGLEPPKYETKKITLTIKGRNMEKWHVDNVKIGSTIVSSKGDVILKVLDKKVTLPESRVLQINTNLSTSYVSYDASRRDLEITLVILAKKIGDNYYFTETQKVKVNESLFISLPEIGNLTLPIISVSSIKDE